MEDWRWVKERIENHIEEMQQRILKGLEDIKEIEAKGIAISCEIDALQNLLFEIDNGEGE